MRTVYASPEQNSFLTELLPGWPVRPGRSSTITSADPLRLRACPATRTRPEGGGGDRALVGGYFGRKSPVIGWDLPVGTLWEVKRGWKFHDWHSHRPYGLDCSGFMGWIFSNITGGEYVLAGEWCHRPASHCTPVSAGGEPSLETGFTRTIPVGIVVDEETETG